MNNKSRKKKEMIYYKFQEPECIKWDANAPLEELEKREIFTCQTLRRNTFLSNTLSMPNKDEQKLYKPQNHTFVFNFFFSSFFSFFI